MAQLNVRLDEQTRISLNALARARGLTDSELTRSLIDDALGRNRPGYSVDVVAPRSLSPVDRYSLALQHEILALLTADPDDANGGLDAEYHTNMVEVLNRGFTQEYDTVFQAIAPELTDRECTLVNDIFEMFRTLSHSFEELSVEDRAELGPHAEHTLTFGGFDFNDSHELRLATYARYLIKTDRWTELAERFDDQHERGNSHMPKLAVYQRMRSAWHPLWEGKLRSHGGPHRYLFSVSELQEVLAASVHPDNR